MDAVVSPSLHKYKLAGLAVSVVLTPGQLVGDAGDIVPAGVGLTVSVSVVILSQPVTVETLVLV